MVQFKRKIYDRLIEWKNRYSGEYALLIEGARRVGKTTLVREFAKNEYRSFLLIDLGENPKNVQKILKDHSGDYDELFRVLQATFGVRLYPRESLIVFDEIQMFPFARQMVKYLVEYGRYPIIETGSLISLRQNVEGIIIPSEEMRIRMHPMDFEEFLWAKGNDAAVPLLREHFENRMPLGPAAHGAMMREYSAYMAVGGMPQAVSKYVSGGDYDSIETVKTGILNLYFDDVMKIRGISGTKVQDVLMKIPSQLSRHGKRFSPSEIDDNGRTRDYRAALAWLEEARIANICYACTDPGPAPELYIDENSLKTYLLDTGLLVTLSFRSNIADRNELYGDLINGDLGTNDGMLLENMVAQELVCKGIRPVFFEFSTEESTRRQEVDFLIQDGRKVVPVEVKSGRSAVHRSLDRYMRKYPDRSDRAFVVHTKDLRTDGDVTYIPAYMAMFLRPAPLNNNIRPRGCRNMTSPKVYFTDMRVPVGDSIPDKLRRLMSAAGFGDLDLDRKFVAIKLHFGERGNLAYLRPNYVKVVADQVTAKGGLPFATDCSTLYVGYRKNGIDHLETAALNGFNAVSCGCPIITGDGLKGTDDVELPVPNGIRVRTAKIGRTICDADFMVTLTHFKGHMMTSFGGAVKNISMGCASRRGKMEMHQEEKPVVDADKCRGCRACLRSCAHDAITVDKKASIDQSKCVGCGRCIGDCRFDAISTELSDALNGVVDKMVEYTAAVCARIPCFHISIVTDVSPGCDCDTRNDVPVVPNIGMFASSDPIALDRACLDACLEAPSIAPCDMCTGEGNLFERVNPGTNSSELFRHAARIGFGSSEYELVRVK